MNGNDGLTLALLGAVGLGAWALRPAADRRVGWWTGILHALMAVATLRGAVAAHDTGFLVAMLTFTVYAAGMAMVEVIHVLRGR
jgi:hypothetical protein